MSAEPTRRCDRAHVALIGAGGNIGSHAAPHLARLNGMGRLTIVDPGRYDASNLSSQNIGSDAIGAPKVDVLARQLRAIDSRLEVVALSERVEDVPLGDLRADVLLSCPDSRRARQAVNAIAWRLGVPWIDAGVEGRHSLARVTARTSGEAAPCLECMFGPDDYAALSFEYGCAAVEAAPTLSPSWLGGLAAALMVSECARLLANRSGARRGWQWTIDADGGTSWATLFRRNPNCRFDHQTWRIEHVAAPDDLTLTAVLALGVGAPARPRLNLLGHSFVRQLVCAECGHTISTLRLSRALDRDAVRCPACSAELTRSAFHDLDALDSDAVAAARAEDVTLGALGFLPGDVVSVGCTHFQLGGAA